MAKAKKLRSLSVYESIINRLKDFRIVHLLPNDTNLLLKIGFEAAPVEGDSILPKSNGKATSFNANGYFKIRKDLPKESQSRTIRSSWFDWHGQRHSGWKHRNYEVYPREHILPPSEYLTIFRRGENLYLCSKILSNQTNSTDEIVNILNIYLEIFDELEIVSPRLDSPGSLQIKKLNWKIFPQGRYPFERVKENLTEYLEQLNENDKPVVRDRIQTITRYIPDFFAIGLGGFKDYIVFGFTARNLYVLESPTLGNATYAFNDSWEQLSNLTKREILGSNLQEARIVHNNNWQTSINELISRFS
jgi:hypothetical protein